MNQHESGNEVAGCGEIKTRSDRLHGHFTDRVKGISDHYAAASSLTISMAFFGQMSMQVWQP